MTDESTDQLPGWCQQVLDQKDERQREAQAAVARRGEEEATKFGLEVRQLIPEGIEVVASYYVGPDNRTIVTWAELKLADDIAVGIKGEGATYKIWSPDPRAEWHAKSAELPERLAEALVEIRAAVAKRETERQKAEALYEQREKERQEQQAAKAARDSACADVRDGFVQQAEEIGAAEELWTCYLPAQRACNETVEGYTARCEAGLAELRSELKRRALQARVDAEAEAPFETPLVLYELSWPRAVTEEGGSISRSAWTVSAEPDCGGWYTVLESGQLKRLRIVAGCIEIIEHSFCRLSELPAQARVGEYVTEDDVQVWAYRLAPCLREALGVIQRAGD